MPPNQREAKIPNTIDRAFYGCGGLTSITIPNSVTSIGVSAFHNCSGLKSVTIGNGVTSIGDEAFRECSGLTEIKVETNNPIYHADENCLIETKSRTLIVGCKTSKIPDDGSVTSIGDGAFYKCSGLTGTLKIPDSVKSIGMRAFSNCSGLTSVTIGNGATSIGSSAFRSCSGLTGELKIPDGVTSIGYEVFAYCSGLTSVTIGSGVTSIDVRAFFYCSGLTSVTIGSGVTSIGERAFYGCDLQNAIFANPNNWYYNNILMQSLNNSVTAAQLLRFNYSYAWKKRV